MAILLHGTTRNRAEQIMAQGPDPDFIEPGGGPRAGGFSICLETGPFPLGTPEEYARRKSAGFPNERGPAILAVDVPDDIMTLAVDPIYFPLSQGVIQFDQGQVSRNCVLPGQPWQERFGPFDAYDYHSIHLNPCRSRTGKPDRRCRRAG